MAARSGTLSPISVDSANDWSPVSKYNNIGSGDSAYSPSVPPTPRNQLITPPTSVTSSTDGMIPNGLGRPPTSNGQPSPPSSIARSSTGDGLYAGSSQDRESISSRKALMIEESLAEHYHVLKIYLGRYLLDEKGNLRPNRARDKLLRLSSVQFQELSTDVYDESLRREDERKRGGPNAPGNDTPKFLPPKDNYHPKRNQARQKLSTLPIDRFRQLATDEKLIADLTAQVEQLQEKAEGLEDQLRERDEEVEKLKNAENNGGNATEGDKAEFAELREDLERRLDEAQSSSDSLRSELEKTRNDASETERELRSQLEEVQRGGNLGGSGDNDWEQRYKQLERELEEQQQVTDEVRREASQFLQEMRALSERSNASLEKEEGLVAEIARLEAEVKEWRTRYARSKTQVRHLRASSTGLANLTEDASVYARDGTIVQPDGLIKDVHLTKFQLSIDQLLQAARKSSSEAVLDCMKETVSCVRSITADVDAAGSPTSDDGEDSVKRQHKLKSRVSATANNLITASKNHAAAQGLSPVSLLDAAASHLTTSVVELAKVVRIRPTQPGEEDYENLDVRSSRLSANYYGNGARHTRTGSNLSIDSASGLEEIKNYLEDQTTDLVNSIQPLVQEIRSTPAGAPFPPQSEQNIEHHVNDINRTVYDIGFKTREAVSNTRNSALAKHAMPVTDILEECREGLLSALQEDEAGKREKIPPLAFKIARATKELVLRVERIENRELTADMTVSNEF
ncbi:putative cell polarity [Diplodia seriata]|uniref:Putative cell polarity n=1 Tax=Diplodia seriata TaxID=420778 RepID=A0A0G2EUC2_9PEZI|nr:putative cell polarity [Diplodia seriata]